jgi:hypothetical protein
MSEQLYNPEILLVPRLSTPIVIQVQGKEYEARKELRTLADGIAQNHSPLSWHSSLVLREKLKTTFDLEGELGLVPTSQAVMTRFDWYQDHHKDKGLTRVCLYDVPGAVLIGFENHRVRNYSVFPDRQTPNYPRLNYNFDGAD